MFEEKVKVPRWLELQGEIDFLIFTLKSMYEQEIALSAIEKMIDESTGFNKIKEKEAKRMIKRVKKLMKEYRQLVKE